MHVCVQMEKRALKGNDAHVQMHAQEKKNGRSDVNARVRVICNQGIKQLSSKQARMLLSYIRTSLRAFRTCIHRHSAEFSSICMCILTCV